MGDIEQGFSEADEIVEEEYRTEAVHQGYIEPHAATALWGSDGYITIWCSSQGQFAIRDHASAILEVPVSMIKVVPMEIGGGFGGKGQGGHTVQEIRQTGEDRHDQNRSVYRIWPDLRDAYHS